MLDMRSKTQNKGTTGHNFISTKGEFPKRDNSSRLSREANQKVMFLHPTLPKGGRFDVQAKKILATRNERALKLEELPR